jgi:Zn-dependent protease
LLIALILSYGGFLFAAPGAVYIQGDLTKEMNGKISLAGPAVNFAISAVAILVLLAFDIIGTIAFAIYLMAQLNAVLGLFNMIPMFPLDGSKIVAWNIKIYIIAVAIGAIELLTVMFFITVYL